MRRFTDFEKQAIQEILDLQRAGGLSVIANFWERLFPSEAYYVSVSDPNSPVLMIRSEELDKLDNTSLQGMLGDLTRTTDSLVSLLRYLEANGYIRLIGEETIETLGQSFVDEKYVAFPLNFAPELFQPGPTRKTPNHCRSIVT